MSKTYIPRPDSAFNTWQANFVAKVTANPAAYGLTPADVADLAASSTGWQASLTASITAKNASKGANAAKSESRKVYESKLRSLTNKIQAQPTTTDVRREELAITRPDRTLTPLAELIIQTEPTPVIKALCTGPKTVRIDWSPSHDSGDSAALPKGIDGVAIWVADGGIPSTKDKWRFLALDTNSPYIHNVKNDMTVTLAYKAQWFDKKKRMGPFGDPVIVAVTP